MKRRTFLASTVAAIAAPAIPASGGVVLSSPLVYSPPPPTYWWDPATNTPGPAALELKAIYDDLAARQMPALPLGNLDDLYED